MFVDYAKDLVKDKASKSGFSWRVTFYHTIGNISQTWPLDEEPDTKHQLPSEILRIIHQQLKKNDPTNQQDIEKILAIREHLFGVDCYWLAQKSRRFEDLNSWFLELLGDIQDLKKANFSQACRSLFFDD